jgi:pyruvate dehydrogenase E2 component (dihydrolipoamide acetyltransferase)
MASAIVMPKAGNSVEECILSGWRIKVGDQVRKGDIIADAETDKTSIEVEATAEGTVLALFANPGDLIPVLTPICAVGAAGEDASSLGGKAEAPKAEAPAAAPAPAPAVPAAPAPVAPAARLAGVEAVLMPKAGNSVEECILSGWRVKVGDAVKKGDIIADAETDKTSIEVESTAEGTVLALLSNPGDLVPVLTDICLVGPAGTDVSGCQAAPKTAEAAPAAPAVAEAPKAAEAPATAPVAVVREGAPLSPRAKKFLAGHPFVMGAIAGSGAQGRIMEADLMAAYQTSPHLTPAAAAMVAAGAKAPTVGTGSQGEITAEDIENFAKGVVATPAAPAAPRAEAPKAAAAPAAAVSSDEDVITEKPFSRIRGVIAKRLQESLQTMAQYTLNCEADVSGLLALRKKIKANGEKLGLANINIGDMVMYAVIKTLQQVPELNGEFSNNVVKLHSAVNMGFACDTAKGLLVPVLHNSHRMSLSEMCRKVKELAKSANAGNLAPDLMSGATFTVSNLGSFGIINFTPVISAPQIAMLGVGKTLLRPVRQADGTIAYRDYMQFSLTMNHMVVDGAPGARFLQTLCANIENFELICIAR